MGQSAAVLVMNDSSVAERPPLLAAPSLVPGLPWRRLRLRIHTYVLTLSTGTGSGFRSSCTGPVQEYL